MNEMIHTTVINCKTLTERKKFILEQFERLNFINYDFYLDYDASDISINDINCYYNQDIALFKNKIKLWNLSEEDKKNIIAKRILNKNSISLTIKLGKIFQKLLNNKEKYFIIFEDDVILNDNFLKKFDIFLENTPTDWNAIYMGECCELTYSRTNMTITKINHPASRCCHAMLFKKQTIEDLSKTWFPFSLITDWEIAYQHYYHNHNVYWWDPALAYQGSETQLFQSTLR